MRVSLDSRILLTLLGRQGNSAASSDYAIRSVSTGSLLRSEIIGAGVYLAVNPLPKQQKTCNKMMGAFGLLISSRCMHGRQTKMQALAGFAARS